MPGLAEIIDENGRLRAVVEAQEASLRELGAQLAVHRSELAKRDAMLAAVTSSAEELARQLEVLKLKASGPTSQRYVPEGQELLPFPGDIAPPPRAPTLDEDDENPTPKKRRGKKPRRRRREDFSHLPSRTVRCAADPDSACAHCGGALRVIGQAESFRINWVPGHFIVEDVVRDKCACPSCPAEGVLTVPGPYAIDRALCGNSLLARVLVDKFCDHLPLHRQARRMARESFQVGTNTLAGWVRQGASLLQALARAVQQDILAGSVVQGDDTGFPVQDGGDGVLRKGRLWAFTDQEHAFYAFTATKEGEYPAQLLEGFSGELLLVDGGSEFNKVVRDQELKRAGCWSHLRTYLYDARHHHPGEAAVALATIRDLFMVERLLWGKPPAEVRQQRQEHARPLIDGLYEWVKALSPRTRPKSALGRALTYAINQEEALRLHLEHGELPMHNNLSELLLRQSVVGRKNWLFARSEGGAHAAATLYTLVGSCMLQGIDPHSYLVDILDRLPDHPVSRVRELMPREWRLAREGHTAELG
jgi:transposase